VLDLAERRGPASLAAGLYRESEASLQRRQRQAEERRLVQQESPGRRPDKRQRRQIRTFRGA